MLDTKELFEAIETVELNGKNLGSFEEMDLNPENLEQFIGMSKAGSTSLLRFRAIEIVYICSSECETIKGIFLYAGKVPKVSKEVLVFIAPYLRCCKIICKLCIIDLDKVVRICKIL